MLNLSFVAVCLSAVLSGVHAFNTTAKVNSNFVALHPASPDSFVTLTFALPPNNIDGLHAALMDVSSPTSSRYGKHLSKSEVEAFVAPPANSVKTVTDWLAGSEVVPKAVSPSGDLLRADIPVHIANSLLGANFTTFLDKSTNTNVLRTMTMSIPANVQQHLKFIYPTIQFIPQATLSKHKFEVVQPPKTSIGKRTTPPDICNMESFPECLQDLYNIPLTPATNADNTLSVAGFLDEFCPQADIDFFFLAFRPDVSPAPTYAINSIDGGVTTAPAGTLEACLDLQYTLGVATGVPVTFESVGDGPNSFIDLANTLLAQDEVPLVLTVSFGFNESDFQGSEPFAENLCNAYAQLGARGTSVFFASGDNGVYSFAFDSLCDATEFGPTFPSTCPFVTSVGGSQNISPEVAAPFSSGGFSNIFPRPSYQDAAVTGYLAALGSTNAGLFNTTGRGFPDISAQSVGFITRLDDEFVGAIGTSAAAPTWASVVALLNDARLNAGMPSLGFINPLLYAQGAAALNDVTSGSNPGCGAQGFPAIEGWDPVTGLGTPDFQKLLDLVLNVGNL